MSFRYKEPAAAADTLDMYERTIAGAKYQGVELPRPATPAVTLVGYNSGASVVLIAANAARLGAAFYNDADKNLYLKLGAGAASNSFTVIVPPGSYYELPFNYTGLIEGRWAAGGAGTLYVTEVTP
jgi:hypothetical protein